MQLPQHAYLVLGTSKYGVRKASMQAFVSCSAVPVLIIFSFELEYWK